MLQNLNTFLFHTVPFHRIPKIIARFQYRSYLTATANQVTATLFLRILFNVYPYRLQGPHSKNFLFLLNGPNKLERSSLAGLSSFVYCLWVRPGASLVQAPYPQTFDKAGKACQGQTLQLITKSSNLLAITTNNRLGLSSLVYCLWLRPGAYPRGEHLGCST